VRLARRGRLVTRSQFPCVPSTFSDRLDEAATDIDFLRITTYLSNAMSFLDNDTALPADLTEGKLQQRRPPELAKGIPPHTEFHTLPPKPLGTDKYHNARMGL